MKCEYGCGLEANYVLLNGKHCCQSNTVKCPIIRKKVSEGISKSYKSGKLKHKKTSIQKYLTANIDDIKDPYWKRRKVFYEQDNTCLSCNLSMWLDEPIALEIDHVDGNNGNWERSNLRGICPNCHAQTDTYRGRNKNSGTFKVEDSVLIESLKTQPSIRQALLKCGLAAKGGNYDRAKRLLVTIE